MSETPLYFRSAHDLAGGLRDRAFTVAEMTNVFLDRIETYSRRCHAFITATPDQAREQAAKRDDCFAHDQASSVFFGIPFATKDLFDIAGVPTTGGSRVLFDNVPTKNAALVDFMLAVGAVSVGKANLHEFAYGATGENAHFGTPVNAYDESRLACGSSSGSAAAVAYGMCTAALGTDTGGSVRVPAVMNGLVGLKPTFERLSLEGAIPYCWSLDHAGLITRTVQDCAAMLAICGPAETQRAAPPPSPPSDIFGGLRIGLPTGAHFERADPEILALTEQVVRALEQRGARARPVSLPDLRFARTVSLTLQMPEALSYHSRYLETRAHLYGFDFRAGLALGQYVLAEHYVRSRRLVSQYRGETEAEFKDLDLIITPATPIPAPKLGTVSVTLGGETEAVGNALTRFTSFFNMTGHPALTMACGMHSLGLPIGIQLVGRFWREATLLAVAAVIEAEFSGSVHAPKIDRS